MKLAVGFFDGVHRGHRDVLAAADAVLTFRNHPAAVLHPEAAPVLLMSAGERLTALADAGAGRPPRPVTALDFTRALADEAPDAFVTRLHALFPDVDEILCGPNWRFGRGAVGDAAFLRAHGFAVAAAPYAEYAGAPVSSTRIRAALAAGDVAGANAMLGRPYAVTGLVRHGKGAGRTLGAPTLNVDPSRPLCLRRGVYAVDTPFGRGIANYGTAPTFGVAAWPEPVLEVHILGDAPVPADVARCTVAFARFLRPERRFPSVTALRAQIDADILLAGKL